MFVSLFIIGNKIFCNSSCSASYNNKIRLRKDNRVKHPCDNCGKETTNRVVCSKECDGQLKSKRAYEKLLLNPNDFSHDTYSPKCAKKHILKEQENKCAICNNINEWQYKKIVFILDHIDGNSTNNMRDNLRLVCPNCDSQLDTYKSKNKNSGRHYRKERYKNGKSY